MYLNSRGINLSNGKTQCAVSPYCTRENLSNNNHSEILEKSNQGEHAQMINKRLQYSSNLTLQLQIFHSVILMVYRFPTTMLVNHSKILDKIRSGGACMNNKQKALINKRLGKKSDSTPQLQIFLSVILMVCMSPTTMMVNHSEILDKIKSG